MLAGASPMPRFFLVEGHTVARGGLISTAYFMQYFRELPTVYPKNQELRMVRSVWKIDQ